MPVSDGTSISAEKCWPSVERRIWKPAWSVDPAVQPTSTREAETAWAAADTGAGGVAKPLVASTSSGPSEDSRA